MAAVSTSFSFSQQKEYSLPLTVSTPFDATSITTPKIYLLDSRTRFEPQPYSPFFAGGIENIADYWLSKVELIEFPALTVFGLERLALWVQVEVATTNRGIGGPISLVTISPDRDDCKEDEISEQDQRRDQIRKCLRESLIGWCNEQV